MLGQNGLYEDALKKTLSYDMSLGNRLGHIQSLSYVHLISNIFHRDAKRGFSLL